MVQQYPTASVDAYSKTKGRRNFRCSDVGSRKGFMPCGSYPQSMLVSPNREPSAHSKNSSESAVSQ
jgi:hypothetical protein